MSFNIILSEPIDPASTAPGFWIDDNVIHVRTRAATSTYRLPRRKPRVTIQRIGAGSEQLVIGGFATTLVTVTGPSETVHQLREAVL